MSWEEIKLLDNVYPDHSISLLMLQTESGESGTTWADKAYKMYALMKL
ncbi:MAG: hypothetical protein H7259_06610 [Cytophagales bacterium]|nr:hypothetical protein [Cytophaga sp.]